jgi:tetratricopeptide (TPR) repeat protein
VRACAIRRLRIIHDRSLTTRTSSGFFDMRRQIIAAALVALSCSAARANVPGKCVQLQNASLAISSCTEFLDAHPASDADRSVAYFYRGTAFSMSQRLDEAIEDLSKAIEADPAWPLPYNNRARTFVEKGEPAKAIADYDKVLELDPVNAAGYVNRALAYMKLKDFDHALADLQKASELKPDNAFTIYNLGEAYALKGDLGRAEAEYRKAQALAPRNQHVIDSLKRIGATP